MLDEIADAIVKALQKALPDFSPDNIGTEKPDLKKAKLPVISVSSAEFTFQDGGVGGGGTDEISDVEEYFNGDGTKTSFTFSDTPIRPMLRVESPIGALKAENADYSVDYAKHVIKFGVPPPKGRQNVLVKYKAASTGSDTKYVQMNIIYNLDIWSMDEKERDSITIDVIKGIALSAESLAMGGMRITPSWGLNLPLDGEDAGNVFVKRLIYSVEANLQVKTPVPRIEKIEIEQEPPE